MADTYNASYYLPLALCDDVNPRCPVSTSIYGYYPSVGANGFFVAAFFMCGAIQLLFGIRYKTWTYV
jgi:hypothetical protein